MDGCAGGGGGERRSVTEFRVSKLVTIEQRSCFESPKRQGSEGAVRVGWGAAEMSDGDRGGGGGKRADRKYRRTT